MGVRRPPEGGIRQVVLALDPRQQQAVVRNDTLRFLQGPRLVEVVSDTPGEEALVMTQLPVHRPESECTMDSTPDLETAIRAFSLSKMR